MGTVANANYGFKGQVSSAETPQVLGIGSLYSVVGKDALKVTAGGTGDRAITVASAPNGAWGDGVLSKWTTGANLTCTANTTVPVRWDTVVVRRVWTPAGSPTGTATLTVLVGGTSAAIAAGRQTDRGVTTSDQPIALVPVPQNSATVGAPIDLRVWAGEGGGLVAENVAALQYLSSKGTTVRIGSRLYTRMEDGPGTLVWVESDLSLPSAYLSLSGAGGWVAGTEAPRFRRVGDEVVGAGLVVRNAATTIGYSGILVGTLPAGMWPAENTGFSVAGNVPGGSVGIEVRAANGQVWARNWAVRDDPMASGQFLSLAQVRFRAAT